MRNCVLASKLVSGVLPGLLTTWARDLHLNLSGRTLFAPNNIGPCLFSPHNRIIEQNIRFVKALGDFRPHHCVVVDYSLGRGPNGPEILGQGSSMAEPLFCKQEVVGSSPTPGFSPNAL